MLSSGAWASTPNGDKLASNSNADPSASVSLVLGLQASTIMYSSGLFQSL